MNLLKLTTLSLAVAGAVDPNGDFTSLGEWWNEIVKQVHDSVVLTLQEICKQNLADMYACLRSNLINAQATLSSDPQSLSWALYIQMRNLANDVMVPLGMIILAFMFVADLYDYVKDMNQNANNSARLIEVIGKVIIFGTLITNAYKVAVALMSLGAQAAGFATITAGIPDLSQVIDVDAITEIPMLIRLVIMSFLINLIIAALNAFITIIIYTRVIKIYVYSCAAPVTLATLDSKDWAEVGRNYLRTIFALGMTGVTMLVVIYAFCILATDILSSVSGNQIDTLWQFAATCTVVVLLLKESENITKSIFNAH